MFVSCELVVPEILRLALRPPRALRENLFMIIGIVAIAKNLAIGRDGKLPWHYPADLKFFKQTTTGNTIVMGWNTWKSIGKPLPNRVNIVLSRKGQIEEQDDLKLMRSKEEVLNLASHHDRDIFIIGGSRTFESFTDEIEKWFVTEIPLVVEDADVFMPTDFLDGFDSSEETDLGDGLRVKAYTRR
jgi:dihydrofolate reductase